MTLSTFQRFAQTLYEEIDAASPFNKPDPPLDREVLKFVRLVRVSALLNALQGVEKTLAFRDGKDADVRQMQADILTILSSHKWQETFPVLTKFMDRLRFIPLVILAHSVTFRKSFVDSTVFKSQLSTLCGEICKDRWLNSFELFGRVRHICLERYLDNDELFLKFLQEPGNLIALKAIDDSPISYSRKERSNLWKRRHNLPAVTIDRATGRDDRLRYDNWALQDGTSSATQPVMSDGRVRRFMLESRFCPTEHKFQQAQDSKWWPNPTEPRFRSEDQCECCGKNIPVPRRSAPKRGFGAVRHPSTTWCRCSPDTWKARDRVTGGTMRNFNGLVELFQTRLGVGVRALQNFRENDLIGEYVGEMYPQKKQFKLHNDSDHYVFTQSMDAAHTMVNHPGTPVTSSGHRMPNWEETRIQDKNLIVVDPEKYGNWTRYLNHSCKFHGVTQAVPVGPINRLMIRAIRDIKFGEEIMITYGEEYFLERNMECKCGASNCISKLKPKTKKRPRDEDEMDIDNEPDDEDDADFVPEQRRMKRPETDRQRPPKAKRQKISRL